MKSVKCLILMLSVLFAGQLQAAEESYQFDTPEQRQLFLELTAELRCPMCQNQNIADSDAMIAVDLRRKVYQLVRQGKSRDEIVDYMKARYGDFVSYQPPVTPVTVWLWLLPLLFVLAAGWFIARHKKQLNTESDEALLEKAEKMLEKDK